MPSKSESPQRTRSIRRTGRNILQQFADNITGFFSKIRINSTVESLYDRLLIQDGDVVISWADKLYVTGDPHGTPGNFNPTGAMLYLQAFNTGANLANGNVCGIIRGMAHNDAGTPEDITYVDVYLQAADITDGAEQGAFFVVPQHNGADAFSLMIIGNQVVQSLPTAAIASGSMLNSQMMLYWDDTAKKIMAKVKNASGTVYTGAVSDALT